MATWSNWFKTAKEKNFSIEKYLFINQAEDLERLHSSGLPFYDFILIDGKNFDKEKIQAFAAKHESTWIRIYNKEDKGEKYHKLGLKSGKEIFSFIESLKIDVSNFNIQLFEYVENKFGGNIASDGQFPKIELIEGKQELVSRSTEKYFHGQINAIGRLAFLEENVPKNIRSTAAKVIDYIKIARKEFLSGYFEFVVSDKGKAYFLDYKKETKAFTS
jgi:hypothetical protein